MDHLTTFATDPGKWDHGHLPSRPSRLAKWRNRSKSLAARIQEILKDGRPPRPAELHVPAEAERGPDGSPAGARDVRLVPRDEEAAFAARCAADEAAVAVCARLWAGASSEGPAAPCLVVDRLLRGAARRTGGDACASTPRRGRAAASEGMNLLTPAGRRSRRCSSTWRRLASAAAPATYAFLVGCGWFDNDGFHTRQFFLRGFGDERALLHAVTLVRAGLWSARRRSGRHAGRPLRRWCS